MYTPHTHNTHTHTHTHITTEVTMPTDLPTVTEALSSEERNADFYAVRILPLVLGVALIIVAMVMLGLLWWRCRNDKLRMKRKGMYKCELPTIRSHTHYRLTHSLSTSHTLSITHTHTLSLSLSVSGAESGSDFELK